MKTQIDTLRQLFLVEENPKFEKAAKVILDDKGDSRFDFINNHRAKKLDVAYETVYETIYQILTTDEKFMPYLSKTDKTALKKINTEYDKATILADDFYDRAFNTFIDKGSAAKVAFDLDETFQKIAEIEKRFKLTGYKAVNKSTSIADKKLAIANMLDEIFIKVTAEVKSKYVEKTIPKKVQSSLNAFEKVNERAIATVTSDKLDEKKINTFTDYVEKLSPSEKEKTEENSEDKNNEPEKVNSNKKWIKIGSAALGIALVAGGIAKLANNDKPIQNPKPGKQFEDEYSDTELTPTPDTPVDINENQDYENSNASTIQTPVNSSENTNYENPDASTMQESERETYIKNLSHTICTNWADLGCDYSEEDIFELIKFLNGYDSSLSAGIADSMLIEMINLASVPATMNAYTGENIAGKIVMISSLLVDDQAGIEAVQKMESYLNSMITDPNNIGAYATDALTTEIRMIAKEETVDGLNVTTQKDLNLPAVRLLWSRLAIGTNAITGVLGDDYTVTIDGETFTQEDINNCEIFENIATQAKTDLGQKDKALKLNY